jgi:hypothetical protein
MSTYLLLGGNFSKPEERICRELRETKTRLLADP